MTIENGGEQPANDTVVSDVQPTQNASPEVQDNTPDPIEPEFDENGDEIVSQPEPVDDTEEVEFEGQKFKVPKPIKQGLMRHADYTRKTTEVAQLRKNLETSLEQAGTVHKEYVDSLAVVKAYDAQLSRYERFDWATAEQSDPAAAAQHFRYFTQLKDGRANAEKAATEKQQTLAMESQRANATRIQEVTEKLKEILPEWSPDNELDLKLTKYGTEQGLSKEDLAQATIRNPGFVKLLNKARLFDEQQAKQKTQQTFQQSQQAKPVTRVTGNNGGAARSTTNSTGDALSDAEWMARERERVRKRG